MKYTFFKTSINEWVDGSSTFTEALNECNVNVKVNVTDFNYVTDRKQVMRWVIIGHNVTVYGQEFWSYSDLFRLWLSHTDSKSQYASISSERTDVINYIVENEQHPQEVIDYVTSQAFIDLLHKNDLSVYTDTLAYVENGVYVPVHYEHGHNNLFVGVSNDNVKYQDYVSLQALYEMYLYVSYIGIVEDTTEKPTETYSSEFFECRLFEERQDLTWYMSSRKGSYTDMYDIEE